MSASQAVDTKQTPANSELQQIAQDILKKIQQVCVFGSSNKEPITTQFNNFLAVLKAINNIFGSLGNPKVLLKISNDRQLIAAIQNKSPQDMWTHNDAYIERGSKIHFVPLDLMTNPAFKILETILKIYPVSKFNFSETSAEKLYAPFADYYLNCELSAMQHELRFKPSLLRQEMIDESRYLKFVKTGVPSDGIAVRDFFFGRIMHYAKVIPFKYGTGNCSHMADVAFLELINHGVACAVSYVEFQKPGFEELNVVVLGNWPQAGCIVLNSWGEDKSKVFTWQGSLNKTPEVAQYAAAHVVFSVSDHKEKLRFKKMLDDANYGSWIDDAIRKDNLAKTIKRAENFVKYLHSSGMLAKPASIATVDAKATAVTATAVSNTDSKAPVSTQVPTASVVVATTTTQEELAHTMKSCGH